MTKTDGENKGYVSEETNDPQLTRLSEMMMIMMENCYPSLSIVNIDVLI